MMPSDANGEYVTLADAARIVGMSIATLDRWARQGRIPSDVSEDGQRVVLRARLVKIAESTEGPSPPDA